LPVHCGYFRYVINTVIGKWHTKFTKCCIRNAEHAQAFFCYFLNNILQQLLT
jgi:hypothetical protein